MTNWRRRAYGNPDRNQPELVTMARRLGVPDPVNTTAVGRGFADLVLPWRGLTVLVEVKRPGRPERRNQERRRKAWTGGPWIVSATEADLAHQLIALDRGTPPARRQPDSDDVLLDYRGRWLEASERVAYLFGRDGPFPMAQVMTVTAALRWLTDEVERLRRKAGEHEEGHTSSLVF